MLRKELLLAVIPLLLLAQGACGALNLENSAPRKEPRPTLLPVVMAVPTSTFSPAKAISSPTPTPTPWPTPTPDFSIPLATPTLPPASTPVVKPTIKPTFTSTSRLTPDAELTPAPSLTRETAICRASHGISLHGQNLEGADLSNHAWGGVNFAYANLRGVDFTGAILRGANLRHANLTGADLTGADLTGADLTGAETTGATFRDLSQLNWIDRELVLTGQLPPIPNWLFPPIVEEPFLAKAEKGDRVAPGQEFWLLSRGEWCGLSATQRLMVMDYAVWLGNTISDWLEEQHAIQSSLDRCPPAVGY